MSEDIRQLTCVAIGGRAVLIDGPAGSGKSSLALALIDRGAQLIGDDGVTLEQRDGALWAAPPPNIESKLEIRNVGIVELPSVAAPVSLSLMLDSAAPRYIDEAETVELAGYALPLVKLWPESPVLALRAEWALRTYGLR